MTSEKNQSSLKETRGLEMMDQLCVAPKEVKDRGELLLEVDSSPFQDTAVDSICAMRVVKGQNSEQLENNIHKDLSSYFCNVCPFVSDDYFLLQQHSWQHRFRCAECDFEAFSRLSVLQHVKSSHFQKGLTYQNLFFCRRASSSEATKRKISEVSNDDDSQYEEMEEEEDTSMTSEPASLEQMKPSKRLKVEESVEQIPKQKRHARVVLSKLPVSLEKTDGTEKEDSDANTEDNDTADEKQPDEIEKKGKVAEVEMKSKDSQSGIRVSARVSARLKDKIKATSEESQKSEIDEGMIVVKTEVFDEEDQGFSPVISNVVGGADSVQEILSSTDSTNESSKAATVTAAGTTVLAKTNAAGEPVKKQLYWKCSYCTYKSLRQVNVTHHISASHPSKPHKYVGTFIEESKSESPEANQPDGGAASGAVEKSSESQTPVQQVSDVAKDVTGENVKKGTNDVPTFKCAHCTFNSTEIKHVKKHMFRQHLGSVIYALDMQAVKQNGKRYLLFCLNEACEFETKDTSNFMEHLPSCMETITTKQDSVEARKKSLELTKKFVPKIDLLSSETTTHRKNRVNYCCTHCSYSSSSNMTMVKKHMVASHSKMTLSIQVIPSDKQVERYKVIFCRHCFWDTKKQAFLDEHMEKKHPNEKKEMPVSGEEEKESVNDSTNSDNHAEVSASKSNTVKLTSNQHNPVKSSDKGSVPLTTYLQCFSKEMLIDLVCAFVGSEMESVKLGKDRLRVLGLPGLEYLMKQKGVKVPRLYQCVTCSRYIFGLFPMKEHNKECNTSVQATDAFVKELLKSPGFTASFCPLPSCDFYTFNIDDLVPHAQKHFAPGSDQSEMKSPVHQSNTSQIVSNTAGIGIRIQNPKLIIKVMPNSNAGTLPRVILPAPSNVTSGTLPVRVPVQLTSKMVRPSGSAGAVLAQLGSLTAKTNSHPSVRAKNPGVEVTVQDEDVRVKVEPVDPDEAPVAETSTPVVKIENVDPSYEQSSSAHTLEAECLYCPGGKEVFSTIPEIKDHLLKNHIKETFTFRDNVSLRMNLNGQIYLCKAVNCNFVTTVLKAYELHVQHEH